MKKSLLTIAFLSASVAALAAVTSNVELCRIAVHSGTASTIISLPLEAVGGSNIMIKNIVLTDNLTAGDTLFATIDGTMYGWKLDANKEWKGANVTEGSITTQVEAEQTLARGAAIWVNRTANLEEPFYLYGQVNPSTTAMTQDLLAGTTTSADTEAGTSATKTYGYTLVGNPNPTDIKLNDSSITWTNAQIGDRIVWGSSETASGIQYYTYTGTENKWGYRKSNADRTRSWVYDITLPAGQGFWYLALGADGAEGARSVSWSAASGN